MTDTSKIRIAISRNGYKDTNIMPLDTTFSDLVNLLKEPQIGTKDGPYLVRAAGNVRSNDHVDKHASLLILDGDKRIEQPGGYNPETVKPKEHFIPGAPDPALVHEALKSEGIGHIISSSFSNGEQGSGYYKYRVYIPCQYEAGNQLTALLVHVFNILYAKGVMLAPVGENTVWSQPWFLPRMPDESRRALFYHVAFEGNPSALDAKTICAKWEAEHPVTKAPRNPAGATEYTVPEGHRNPVKEFNELYTIEDILEAHDYVHFPELDRWQHPNSTSTPGVRVLERNGERGAFSHSDNDPLNQDPTNTSGKRYKHDAFDCYRILSCEGNWSLALAWNPDIETHNMEKSVEGMFEDVRTPDEVTGGITEKKPELPDPLGKQKRKSIFTDLDDIIDDNTPVDWLIDELVERNTMGLIYGPPASYKSYLATKMAVAIAQGVPFVGRDTKQGVVLIIAGEGHTTYSGRGEALRMKYGVENFNRSVKISEKSLQLNELTDCLELAAEIKAMPKPPELVIVDTLGRNFSGDENSSAEINNLWALMERHIKPLGPSIMFIHHTGKTSNSPRGSTAIQGNVDYSYEVSHKEGEVTFRCEKLKSARKADPIALKVKLVPLNRFYKERQETNCYLEYVGKAESPSKLTDLQRCLLNDLIAVRDMQGEPVAGGFATEFPEVAGELAVSKTAWRAKAGKGTLKQDSNPSQTFKRGVDSLEKKGFVRIHDQMCVFVNNGSENLDTEAYFEPVAEVDPNGLDLI